MTDQIERFLADVEWGLIRSDTAFMLNAIWDAYCSDRRRASVPEREQHMMVALLHDRILDVLD